MARERKGYVQTRNDGSIWARVTYVGDDGRRRELRRRAETKTAAKEIIKALLRELDDNGQRSVDGSRLRFRDLASIYEEARLFPAQYQGERKIAGLRSWKTPRRLLRTLVDHFGNLPIKSITHSDIERFKLHRLKTPTVRGCELTIASVNRELELMRAVMRYAHRQGWIPRSPFETGAPLISKADEVRRERVLTHDEEARLLAACEGRRAHLRPLLITALDTAMRRGELFQLRWSDVDFQSGVIKVRATTTKTMRARTVGMTKRVSEELSKLWEISLQDPDELVFGVRDTVKKGFASACREAGITNFRFHDIRHTAITRMVQTGAPQTEIMKVSGHTQMITFLRYVNPNEEAVRRAAELLDGFNARAAIQVEGESVH